MPSRISKEDKPQKTDKQNNKIDLALPEDEMDDSVYKEFLTEDGLILTGGDKVLKSNSKVSTHYNKEESKEGLDQGEEWKEEEFFGEANIGRKQGAGKSRNVKDLRKTFGVSWSKISRKVFLVGSAVGLFLLVGVSGFSAWAIDMWNTSPNADDLITTRESSVMYANDGETVLFKFFDEEKREVVELENIPEVMQLATIALEDENFYKNEDGIPWSNIIGSGVDCGRIIVTGSNESCRGGSGLSQQLVKMLTGDDDVAVDRKVRELFTSIKMNQDKSKEDILALYLNTAPYGRNAYGIQEATKAYFDKDVYATGNNALTPDEACLMGSMVQRPTAFSLALAKKDTDPENPNLIELMQRKNACLDKLYTEDFKGDGSNYFESSEEVVKWQEVDTLSKVKPRIETVKYPHFVEYVKKELVDKNIVSERELYTKGLKIVTTIDPRIQDGVENIIREREGAYILANGANNVASIVLDGPKGEIVAMIGSRDYYNKDIDGSVNITTSPKQPGSSVKPYVYASAFENNFNPGTILMNTRTNFGGGFTPRNLMTNWDGQPVTIRHSLQNSLNIPTVKAVFLSSDPGTRPNAGSGTDNFLNYTRRTGVEFPCIQGAFNNLYPNNYEDCSDDAPVDPDLAYRGRCYLASAIGGCELTMLSHANGLNTFAQQGKKITATPFKHIYYKDSEGEQKDLYKILQEGENPPYPIEENAVSPDVARQITDVLADTSSRRFGTTLNNRLVLPGRPVAAKTGTSNDGATGAAVDAWTVGYTPQYTATVWVGTTTPSPIRAGGISAAAPIWKDIMLFIHEGLEVQQFNRDGLTAIRLSPTTGLISKEGRVEYLTSGQIDALRKAGLTVSRPEYDPRKNSIFQSYSTIVPRTVKVNKVDGKIAKEGETPSELIIDLECVEVVSEFPLSASWLDPVTTAMEGKELGMERCPSEESDYDPSKDGLMNIDGGGLVSGDYAPLTIEIRVVPAYPENNSVSSIKFYIDGVLEDSVEGSDTLTFDSFAISGTRDLKIVAEDQYGATGEKTYSNVNFNFSPLSNGDLSGLNNVSCKSVDGGDDTSCSFKLEKGKYVTSLSIKVGLASSSSCDVSGSYVSCSGVPTSASDSGSNVDISLSVGSGFVTTDSSVEIK